MCLMLVSTTLALQKQYLRNTAHELCSPCTDASRPRIVSIQSATFASILSTHVLVVAGMALIYTENFTSLPCSSNNSCCWLDAAWPGLLLHLRCSTLLHTVLLPTVSCIAYTCTLWQHAWQARGINHLKQCVYQTLNNH